MSEKPTMTLEEALKLRRKWMIAFAIVCITPVALLGYGLAHPAKHVVLLVVLGAIVVPVIAAITLNKTGSGGLLSSDAREPVT